MTESVNKRAEPRTRTLYKGKVVTDGRFSLIDCTVRDLSDGGARLEFGAAYIPPEEFDLEIPSRKFRVRARAVWSRGLQVGVTFPGQGARPQDSSLDEADYAAVQRIVDEARGRIAQAIGVEPEQVKLAVELPARSS